MHYQLVLVLSSNSQLWKSSGILLGSLPSNVMFLTTCTLYSLCLGNLALRLLSASDERNFSQPPSLGGSSSSVYREKDASGVSSWPLLLMSASHRER